jgi:PAS domain S-box-containing protein
MASPPDDSGSQAAIRDDSTTDDRPELIANHVLDAVSDSVIVLSPDWRFTYVNRAALERAGLLREQVIGRSLWELRSASPVDFQRVRAAAAGGKPFHLDQPDGGSGTWSEHVLYPSAGMIVWSRDITDRKQTEQRLAHQAQVLDNAHEAIVATDERLVITTWNRAAESLYGWTAAEVIGRDIREVLRSALDTTPWDELFRIVQETGLGTAGTIHHRKNDPQIYLGASVIALRDESNRLTGYVASFRDVTASVSASEVLKDREAQLQEAQHLAHVGSWEWDIAADRMAWSDELCRIWGVDRSQFKWTYAAVRELIHPDDRQTFDEVVERTIHTRVPYVFEHRIVRPDRTVRILQSRGDVIVGATEHPIRMLGTSQDITERTRQLSIANDDLHVQISERSRAEDALRRSSRRVANILESIAEAFVALDSDFCFTYINERALDQIRNAKGEALTRNDLLGTRFWDVFPEEVGTAIYDKYVEAARQRRVVQYETHSEANDTWHEVHVYPSEDGLSVYSQEVTERKRAELELIRVKDQLASDLKAMIRLHEVSSNLLNADGPQSVLEQVLDASIELQRADFGLVQLCNPHTNVLTLVAQRGFTQDFVERFNTGDDASTPCGRAMLRRERVIIEDVATDSAFELYRHIAEQVGFRAVQSTPLISRTGELLGIVSTHFRNPHRPSDSELRFTDLYTLRAATLIERQRAEDRLWRGMAYLTEAQQLTHCGSWAWNVASGELFWSKEHFSIFGLNDGAKVSQDEFVAMIHPEDRVSVKHAFEAAVRERRDCTLDYRIVRPDGSVRYIHSSSHPVVNESGDLFEIVGAIVDTTLHKQEEEVRMQLLRRIVHAQEDERRRISREMHDQFGQLSALTVKLAAMKDAYGGSADLREQLQRLEDTARQLDADADAIVWQLRPPALDDHGLQTALANHAKTWSAHLDIHVELQMNNLQPFHTTDEIAITLYRVVQEALNNVAKHAHARNVAILLEGRRDHVSLIIEDDGSGFDVTQAFAPERQQLGLRGIRERIMAVGGTFDIESEPGTGTTIVVRIPTNRSG